VSRNFSYTWDATRPLGDRVDAAGIRLDGRPIDLAALVAWFEQMSPISPGRLDRIRRPN
jgi:hypothetical protein